MALDFQNHKHGFTHRRLNNLFISCIHSYVYFVLIYARQCPRPWRYNRDQDWQNPGLHGDHIIMGSCSQDYEGNKKERDYYFTRGLALRKPMSLVITWRAYEIWVWKLNLYVEFQKTKTKQIKSKGDLTINKICHFVGLR